MNLTKKQVQHLKSLAHPLKPVVQLGANGLTEGVISEIENALSYHELIKVKIPTDDREYKQQVIEAIVRETGALKVHTIGHILVLYKQNPEKRKIDIPRI